jgi:hypothetical protein
MIWANLLHLSFNMWSDCPVTRWGDLKKRDLEYVCAAPDLRFDERLWRTLTARMAKAGMNMVVIDLGDAVRYASHPEIAVKGAWPRAKLRQELARLRKLGLEPIPKLNFSTAHDAWLGLYARCVSTPLYYKVCADLIAEVVELFDRPRLFHLGYDEENFGNQQSYRYAVIRQQDLWWNDFRFFVAQVEQHGVRPWIWSDYAWHHGPEFYRQMPKSVLQSNWWYGLDFDPKRQMTVRTYLDLEQHKYDQIPTGSNWCEPNNFKRTVAFCIRRIPPARLKGFLQTPWVPTVERFRAKHLEAIDLVAEVIARVGSPKGRISVA